MRVWLTLLLSIVVLPGSIVSAVDTPSEADNIKAAFIINFVKFTRWPEYAAKGTSVCFPTVAEPVGAAMVRQHANTEIDGQLLEIHRGLNLDDLKNCRVVYLGNHDDYRRSEILGEVASHNILTISDLKGFNMSGGMVELFKEGNKYRFSVNIEAVNWEQLEINARILGLARQRETRP